MLALRLPFAATSGGLVTLTVFIVLWHFVSAPTDAGRPLPATTIDWKRLRIDTPVEVKRQDKTPRPPPPPTLEAPRLVGAARIDPPTSFAKARFEPVAITRTGSAPPRLDGDAMPIVRPPPDYPPREIAKGTQGWVRVRFAVTTIGTVRDAIVVDAEPRGVFDTAALKAIARWRYNPKVENGLAVERVGLETVIRFRLDE